MSSEIGGEEKNLENREDICIYTTGSQGGGLMQRKEVSSISRKEKVEKQGEKKDV